MEEEVTRVKLPKRGEILGVIEEKLGGSRFRIDCKDGRKRLCRIPGKFRRRFKFRVGDVVIIKPWDIDPEKGDIVFIYSRTQVFWLRKKGIV